MKNTINHPPTSFSGRWNIKAWVLAMLAFSLLPKLEAQLTFCTQPVTASITSASMSTLFPGGGAWAPGSVIGVSGVLTVDQSATFDNLTFIMGDGASIRADGNGVVLSAINGTSFGACRFAAIPKMWMGISAQNGAALSFVDATIRDGWYGMRFFNGSNTLGTTILRCDFQNCMYGIGIFSVPLFRPAVFAGNSLRMLGGTSLLEPPTTYSYSGTFLHRAIWTTSSTVDISTGATSTNRIEGYRYGIWCFGSTVTVSNMKFQGNINDPALQDTLDGTDIYSWRSNMNVGGSGSTSCTFIQAQNSSIISTNTLGLSVSGATFDNPYNYGIRCPQSIALSAPISIKDNFFNMSNGYDLTSAIYVERPPSGPTNTNVEISGNTIRRNAGHDKGKIVMIDVQGKVPAFDITLIKNNPIDIDRAWPNINGIRVTGKGLNYQILDNKNLTWDLNPNPQSLISNLKSRGIIANDLLDGGHEISGNVVTSTLLNEKSYLRAGIFMENNPLVVRLCKNATNATHKGIECRGNLGNTTLKSNMIGSAAYGLYCEAGNIMPNQDRFENIWLAPSYFFFGAKYNGPVAPFNIFFDPSNAIPNDVPPSAQPLGWFSPLAGSNGACYYGGGDGNGGNGLISPDEADIINEIKPDNNTAENWDARQRLLYKLYQMPELQENSEINRYLTVQQAENASPYRFAYAEHLFDQAYLLPAQLQNEITEASTVVSEYFNQISKLDGQLVESSSNVAQQRALAIDELNAATKRLDQLREEAAPVIRQNLTNALNYTNALPTDWQYEANLKNILQIAIRYAMGDSLTNNDYNRLRTIAAQCPSTGGISVRRAPQWLPHQEAMFYVDKDWNDGCEEASTTKTLESSNNGEVLIMPNPANDYFQIQFPENATGTWSVVDQYGKLVADGTLSNSTLHCNTKDWQSGVYFFVWKSENGARTTSKVIITR